MQKVGKHPLKQQAHPRSLPRLGAVSSEHAGEDASRKRLSGAPLAAMKGSAKSLPSLIPNHPRVPLPVLQSLREQEMNVAQCSKPATPELLRFSNTMASFRSTAISFPAGRLPALQKGAQELLPMRSKRMPLGKTNASFFCKASRASTPVDASSISDSWSDGGHLTRLKTAELNRHEGLRLKRALEQPSRGVNIVTGVTSKRNQAKALAADRGFVVSNLMREEPDSRLQRAQAFNDNWLACLFAPVPKPTKLLSAQIASRLPPSPMDDMRPQEDFGMRLSVFEGHARLTSKPSDTAEPTHPATPIDPATPSSPSSIKKQTSGVFGHPDDEESEEFELEFEDLQHLVKLIQDMNALSTPNAREHSKPTAPAIMTRAAFCRLACALDGLYSEHRPRLRRAVAHFDAHTENFTTEDEHGMKREVLGIRISTPLGGKERDAFEELEELPITKLFKVILQQMYDDACNAGTRRRTAKQNLRTQIFKEAIPRAREYCKWRSACLEAQIGAAVAAASLESSRAKQPTTPPENNEWSEPIDRDDYSNQLAKVLGYPPKGTEQVQTKDGKVMSVSEFMGLKGDKLKKAFPFRVWREVEEVVPESDEKEQAESVEQDFPQQPDATSNYATTFVVLKGETLLCQLFEPEVIGVIYEVSNVLNRVFQAYSDMPTPDGRGHMSLAAFLRFLGDFGWFPELVDYKTIQWLYGGVAEEPVSEPESPVSEETPSEGRMSVGGKTKKRKARRRLPSGRREEEDGDPLAGFTCIFGKWAKSHLTWIAKDPAQMSDSESRSVNILKAMVVWMRTRDLTTNDFFQFIVKGGSRSALSVEGLRIALEFMNLDNPPTEEDIRELILLLLPPEAQGDGTQTCSKVLPDVDLADLQGAMSVAGLLKEPASQASDLFLKDLSKLTKEESDTVIFFRETLHIMELTNKTPDAMFDLYDTDKAGLITEKQMTIQTHALMRMVGVATSALSVDTPLAPLNFKGNISKIEFCNLLALVKEAERVRATEKQTHPVFLSSNARTSTPQRCKHIFGPTAFVETLVKISLEYITQRGNPTQRKLSSSHKVLWMFVFLQWSFESAKSRAAAKATSAGADAVLSDSPGGPVRRPCPKSLPPLQWLISRHPHLFDEELRVPAELPQWATQQDLGDVLIDLCIGESKCPAVTSDHDQVSRPEIRTERSIVPFDRLLLNVMTGER